MRITIIAEEIDHLGQNYNAVKSFDGLSLSRMDSGLRGRVLSDAIEELSGAVEHEAYGTIKNEKKPA